MARPVWLRPLPRLPLGLADWAGGNMTAKQFPGERPFVPDWPAPDPQFLRSDQPSAPPLPLNDVMGPRLADWVAHAAEARGAPPDYVLGAFLAVAGAAIGNARWASPWQGWCEPPIIWVMCIGLPSAGKSPAIDAALNPLRKAEKRLRDIAMAKRARFDEQSEIAAIAETTWKEAVKAALKEGKPAPDKPANCPRELPPHTPRLVVNDATIERLGVILSRQPKGILQMRDELPGWLEGMSRYSGAGSDRPFWLEAYGGRPYSIERLSREPLSIDRLSVWLVGGIQPDRLRSLLLKTDDDGLLARLVPIWPDPVPLRRPTRMVDDAIIQTTVDRLLSLDLVAGEDGDKTPVIVSFSADASARLDDFRRTVRTWETQSEGLILSFLGKLPGIAGTNYAWGGDAGSTAPRVVHGD